MRLSDVRNEEYYDNFKKILYTSKKKCKLTNEQFALLNAEFLSDNADIPIISAIALCDTIMECSNDEELKSIIIEILEDISKTLDNIK